MLVIPGRAAGASPESITPTGSIWLKLIQHRIPGYLAALGPRDDRYQLRTALK